MSTSASSETEESVKVVAAATATATVDNSGSGSNNSGTGSSSSSDGGGDGAGGGAGASTSAAAVTSGSSSSSSSIMTPQEAIASYLEEAQEAKDSGNAHFASGDWNKAMMDYHRACLNLTSLGREHPRMPATDADKAASLELACMLNLIQAQLNAGMPDMAYVLFLALHASSTPPSHPTRACV